MEFSNPNDIQASFEKAGGEFISPLSVFMKRLPNIKAFVFDWDGVFNDGFKPDNNGSPFSESSSMGVNMLRYSYFLKNGVQPHVFIITGENNLPALKLAQREHYHGVYLSMKNKLDALRHIEEQFGITSKEVAFAFDDILDLGMAERTGLRFAVKREANPLMNEFVKMNGLADYRTAVDGDKHAVREICELLIGMNGNYTQTIEGRFKFTEGYTTYLNERNNIVVQLYEAKTGEIRPFEKE
ncbi:MAG: phosphatase [Cyclobacteriaceae bacterium]|nr:phosphatase [Cyclobacteriaceae bacterium]